MEYQEFIQNKRHSLGNHGFEPIWMPKGVFDFQEEIISRYYYEKNSLRIRLRNRISKALRQQNVKKQKTINQYGIDIAKIAEHLGSCPGSMKDFHIDHIVPLSSFDLTDINQLQKAFSPENHQWLTAEENMRKGSKHA